ncbi:DDE superfamily endonuclease [Phytophthora infestans]|uniref:DDE superfamily endonuclease n=1 Tax=Phytophthora infestans TaxID=4787 RepID=A0A8S9VDL1_PHYIN|nr:DDE superfamily endonuclease [Phytophthora infestans]
MPETEKSKVVSAISSALLQESLLAELEDSDIDLMSRSDAESSPQDGRSSESDKEVDELADLYTAWPSATKRTTSSAFHSARYGLSGAIGFVDGTFVNFSQKPHVDGHLFFTRKKRYRLNVQIFCDEDQRILHVHTGWPGSCGDALVFSHTQVSKNSERYFSIGEYLIGDSGYALSERLFAPYKMPRAARSDNARFNTIVSSARVVNENCIGALKNRWASLYGVRTQIKVAEDFDKVNNHILCVLLHNVTLQRKDPWTEEDREDFSAAEGKSDDEDDDGCCIDTPPASRNAENKREMIKRRVL